MLVPGRCSMPHQQRPQRQLSGRPRCKLRQLARPACGRWPVPCRQSHPCSSGRRRTEVGDYGGKVVGGIMAHSSRCLTQLSPLGGAHPHVALPSSSCAMPCHAITPGTLWMRAMITALDTRTYWPPEAYEAQGGAVGSECSEVTPWQLLPRARAALHYAVVPSRLQRHLLRCCTL